MWGRYRNIKVFFWADYFVNLFLPLLRCNLLLEKCISLHEVIKVNKSPIWEIYSVSKNILFMSVIDQTECWWRFKRTLKYRNMITRIIRFESLLRFSAYLAYCVICDLHSHTQCHLEIRLSHVFSLLSKLLFKVCLVLVISFRVLFKFFCPKIA